MRQRSSEWELPKWHPVPETQARPKLPIAKTRIAVATLNPPLTTEELNPVGVTEAGVTEVTRQLVMTVSRNAVVLVATALRRSAKKTHVFARKTRLVVLIMGHACALSVTGDARCWGQTFSDSWQRLRQPPRKRPGSLGHDYCVRRSNVLRIQPKLS